MTEEEKIAADKARKDSEDKAKADSESMNKAIADAVGAAMKPIADRMDSLSKRMDESPTDPLKVADKAKADAEAKEKEEAEAKAKADAEEAEKKEAEEKKADAARCDAERPMFADAQARADSVFAAFGERAPAPLEGERLIAYRQRLAAKLKGHSAGFKDLDLNAINDATVLGVVEKQIYADAAHAARNPTVARGQLREVVSTTSAGHRVSTFHGDSDAWMKPLSMRCQTIRINKEAGRGL